MIAWNESDRRVRFGSCERNPAWHGGKSLERFRSSVDRFLETKTGRRFRDWQHELALYSPLFPTRQRAVLEQGGWKCRDLDDFRTMLGERDNGDLGELAESFKFGNQE